VTSVDRRSVTSAICVKISWQSHYYFQRYGHLKVLQIWLKMPIPAPKIFDLGDFDPKRYFSSSGPPKGTSLAETAHFEPLSVAIGPAVGPGQSAKSTKKGSPERSPEKWGIGPAHALNPILTMDQQSWLVGLARQQVLDDASHLSLDGQCHWLLLVATCHGREKAPETP